MTDTNLTTEHAVRLCKLYSLQLNEIDRSWLDSCVLLAEASKLRHPDLLPKQLHNKIESSLGLTKVLATKDIDPIFLLNKEELHELITLVGSTLLHKEISHVILSTKLKLLKSSIGEDIYNFALRKGKLYNLNTSSSQTWNENVLSKQTILNAGLSSILNIVKKPSDSIEQRFWLKLPISLKQTIPESDTDYSNQASRNKIIKLLRDYNAKCLPLIS